MKMAIHLPLLLPSFSSLPWLIGTSLERKTTRISRDYFGLVASGDKISSRRQASQPPKLFRPPPHLPPFSPFLLPLSSFCPVRGFSSLTHGSKL